MDNKSLIRISVACSLAGMLMIFGLSQFVEPKGISVNLLDRYSGRIVRVTGTVVNVRKHEAGHVFLRISDESGSCDVPLFKDIARRAPAIVLGDRVQVIGIVEEYRDEHQVVPRTASDVAVVETPPIPIKDLAGRVGETVKIRGIAYGVAELEGGQEFHLTDLTAAIMVTSGSEGMARRGRNMTISGVVKVGSEGEHYLRAMEILDISTGNPPPSPIRDLGGSEGVFLVRGSIEVEKGEIEDGTGVLSVGEELVGLGIIDGDLVEAIVLAGDEKMKVLDVELDQAKVMPLERLSGEMVGRTVRVRGTVVSKFVSGKNTFLTIHNGSDVEVPLFGVGGDFNVQLGDDLTVSGRVGIYRDRIQVIPRELTESEVEPGRVIEKELDELGMEDLYELVRVRGRVSSIKRYSQSCSIWIRGETERVRVYLTFQPRENISVGTEIELVGLVKSYRDELELVPRGPEDLG